MTPGARLAARKAARAARKAAQKGTAPAPVAVNKFGERMSRSAGWLRERRLAIGGAALAAVVLVAGWTAWSWYTAKTARAASQVLKEATSLVMTPLQSQGQPSEVAQLEEGFESQQERARAALEAYRKVVSGFQGSSAAAWAELGKANALFDLRKHGESHSAYESLLRNAGEEDVFLKWRALEGSGMALEAQKKYAEASKRFEKLGLLAGGIYRPVADYHLARVRLAEGNREKAVDLLKGVVKALRKERASGQSGRFPYVLAEAEARLRELGEEPEALEDEGEQSDEKSQKASEGSDRKGGRVDAKRAPSPPPSQEGSGE